MLTRLSYLVALLLTAATAFAQQGVISGTVYDESGETLPGANVVVEGTATGAQTDFIEGKYQFRVEPGTYTIVASFVGYADTKIEGVVVTANETTILDIVFDPTAAGGVDLTEVVVTEKALERGEVAVMKVRQNDINAKDLISSQEMTSLGVSNVSGALAKVTGTTVVDGKYVYVRGLGDRYSATTINGLRLPSIDPYRNSAQLDLIPTSILDNIAASKTFTPNLPGDFTGGSVDVKIKALPERFTWGVSASTAYNGQANLRSDFLTFADGNATTLGYAGDNLSIPIDVNNPRFEGALASNTGRRAERDADLAGLVEEVADAFGNGFNINNKNAGMDWSLSANIGNQFSLGNMPLGFFATVSASQDFSQYQGGIRGNYVNPGVGSNGLQEVFNLRDDRSTQQSSVGGMVGFNLRLNPANNISLYTLYSHQGSVDTRILQGSNESKGASGAADNNYVSRASGFLERQLLDYVLQGDHTLTGLGNTKIEWTANLVNSEQNEPDLRFVEYIDQGTSIINDPSQFSRPSRFFRDLTDESYEGKVDITVPVLTDGGKKRGNNIKFGGQYRTKERDFNETIIAFADRRNLTLGQTLGNFDEYFGDDNTGIIGENGDRSVIGVYAFDNTTTANSYVGSDEVAAGYLMTTLELTPRLKVTAGLRGERTQIFVESAAAALSDPEQRDRFIADIDTLNLMPAANLVFKVRPNHNLRLGYSQTVARPNMREVAPFGSFGFFGDPPVFGNPDLTLTSIDNYDLRYEIFPENRGGEVLSVSAFYKQFTNPIVTTFRLSGEQQFTWTNSEEANLYGVELEVRRKLDFLPATLANLTFSGNLAYIQSDQSIDEQECAIGREVDPTYNCERTFNGQSEFVGNANLSYRTPESGWDAIVAFNYFGDRLQSIGAPGSPDIFEQGRAQLDLSVSKQVGNFKLRLKARNLLNPDYKTFSEFQGQEYIFSQYTRGREISLGVSYGI